MISVARYDEISRETYSVSSNRHDDGIDKRDVDHYFVVEDNTSFSTLTLPAGIRLPRLTLNHWIFEKKQLIFYVWCLAHNIRSLLNSFSLKGEFEACYEQIEGVLAMGTLFYNYNYNYKPANFKYILQV